LRSTDVDIHKSGDNIYLCWRKVKNSVGALDQAANMAGISLLNRLTLKSEKN